MSISGTTRVAAVWGYPVAHSASPAMHNAAFAATGFDGVYVASAVAPERIGDAVAGLRAFDMLGANVTVPLKECALPHLDKISDAARAIGAVNTIVNKNGELWGDSTDGAGFLAALEHAGAGVTAGSRFVVLGAGGSARAVVYALLGRGASVVIANRNRERATALAADFAHLPGRIAVTDWEETAIGAALTAGATVLVNTTSVGMVSGVTPPRVAPLPSQAREKEGDLLPVPLDALVPGLFVADLVYKPRETVLLAAARERGCRTQNGLEMLIRQGAVSFEYWTGIAAPVDVMRAAIG